MLLISTILLIGIHGQGAESSYLSERYAGRSRWFSISASIIASKILLPSSQSSELPARV